MRRTILSIFIPNPFAYIRNMLFKVQPKWEDIPKAERGIDGYSVYLAQRFMNDE